jgi:hypothetical protein
LANTFSVGRFDVAQPRVVASSNPGLKLANAFGVRANVFGVQANVFGVQANVFGVQTTPLALKPDTFDAGKTFAAGRAPCYHAPVGRVPQPSNSQAFSR